MLAEFGSSFTEQAFLADDDISGADMLPDESTLTVHEGIFMEGSNAVRDNFLGDKSNMDSCTSTT